MAISFAKRIDPLAATGLVSSYPLGSPGKKITAPAPQGPGFSRQNPSVKAKHDLSGASERNSWIIFWPISCFTDVLFFKDSN